MAQLKLADLVSKARARADMGGSGFVSDADVTEMLNVGLSELYEFMVATHEDYFISSYALNTINGIDEYDLSAVAPGILKLRGIDLLITSAPGNAVSLRPFQWSERQQYSLVQWTAILPNGSSRPAYHLLGSKLKLAPPPDGAYSLKIWYVPNFVPLDNTVPGTSDVLSIEIKPGWEDYAVLSAVITMLSKEQNDVSHWEREQARVKQRIVGIAPNRDADAAPVMVRRNRNRDYGAPGEDH